MPAASCAWMSLPTRCGVRTCRLWGLVAVQNYMMRLRKALGDADHDRIITQPPGYLIRVEAGELDVSRFEALLGAARAAARDGSWDQAATQAREARELWR